MNVLSVLKDNLIVQTTKMIYDKVKWYILNLKYLLIFKIFMKIQLKINYDKVHYYFIVWLLLYDNYIIYYVIIFYALIGRLLVFFLHMMYSSSKAQFGRLFRKISTKVDNDSRNTGQGGSHVTWRIQRWLW